MKDSVIGSEFILTIQVTKDMIAVLDSIEIHPVYSTFWLVYHAELAARKAIEPFFVEGEQAAGVGICLQHKQMAAIGEWVTIKATVKEMSGKSIICDILATIQGTNIVLSTGTQSQVLTTQESIDNAVQKAYARLHSTL